MSIMHNLFGGNQSANPNPMPGPFGNFMQMLQRFNQFRKNPLGAIMGLGINVPQNVGNNPEAIVNYLRSSGQMSDQQFDQFSQMAEQFQNFMPKNS